MIKVENLSCQIGGAPILRDVSVMLPKGNVTALIGPNGAGKSTLLSLIARLRPLQEGQIMVDDLQVGQCSDRDLARKLAILPQSSQVYPRLTLRELVSFGRYPHHQGRPTAEDQRKVDDALDLFELSPLADRPLDTLSGGQRQRANIAMTFVQDTDYILLDEPLNNLDIAAARALMQLLRQVTEQHARTIVIVLHDINYASGYADHIVTLKDGCLGPSGPPQEVINSALLQEVFNTDAEVHQISGQTLVKV